MMQPQAEMFEAEQIRPAVHPVFGGLPWGEFAAICADPPWRYVTWSEKNQTRSAAQHYGVMTIDDICALPVADLAARDAALFLWAVNPMLPHALRVMEAWGFKFSTMAFTWAKTTTKTEWSWAPKWHMGLGHWTRSNVEIVLLGTRGKPKRVSRAVRQLIMAPRREHSRKPDEFYASVERLVPGPYLDLFSRQTRPGWSQWGKEQTKFNSKSDEQAAIIRA
jgi:N6-adenosine-specific RNA methylase IME4